MVRGGPVGLVFDERMCAHEHLGNKSHPERPQRIKSIFKSLKSAGIVDRCVRVEARHATTDELESVHKMEHITKCFTQSQAMKSKKLLREVKLANDDIYVNESSYSSALLAAGSVVDISLRVARGDLSAGAAVVRPPGHHAEADKEMGFCFFNNVAVAAKVLVDGYHPDIRVERVLIVDWDVHHGNGTQHTFYEDPNVLYFSIHRKDIYPGGRNIAYKDGDHNKVGKGSGVGFNINVPWPGGGFGDSDYLAVFNNLLLPVAHEFKPGIVLVSAGFDAAMGDVMGGCKVTPAGYSQMTNKLMDLAKGRLVLVLEGGYNLDSLSASYLACMKVLLGGPPEEIVNEKPVLSTTTDLVQKVQRVLRHKWRALSTKRAFNNSLSVDPGKNKVIAGCPVDNSLIQTKDVYAVEKSGLGVKATDTGNTSRSGYLKIVSSQHISEESKTAEMVVETISQSDVVGDHTQVHGIDAEEQRLTMSKLANRRGNKTRNARGEDYDYESGDWFNDYAEVQEGDKLESFGDLAGPFYNLRIS